jgi:UDP-perosamine 4-acetyltransferase
MTRRKLILLGAGGHAKVVLEALNSSGITPAACLDPDARLHGTALLGVPVEGGDERLAGHPPASAALVLGVGAPRPGKLRKALFERYRAQGYAFPPVVAASALCAESVTLGAGAQVLTRAVVHPGSSVGENAIVNTGAIVEHDCAVGAHAHIAPGVVLCGGVRVGAEAFVGAGAVLLPGVRVGRGALVAAGVVVRKDVPARGRALPRGTR